MLPIPSDNRILYYRRDREAFPFFSHFWPSPLVLDGKRWPTVEHYYQAQKSFDKNYRSAIRAAKKPRDAKRLAARPSAEGHAGKFSWFKANEKQPRADWSEVKLDVMRRADLAKYTQNSDLRDLLVATGDAELVEDSHGDAYWGIGFDGNGANWAGRVLMEVRTALNACAQRK